MGIVLKEGEILFPGVPVVPGEIKGALLLWVNGFLISYNGIN